MRYLIKITHVNNEEEYLQRKASSLRQIRLIALAHAGEITESSVLIEIFRGEDKVCEMRVLNYREKESGG